jgi:hypothetical protein
LLLYLTPTISLTFSVSGFSSCSSALRRACSCGAPGEGIALALYHLERLGERALLDEERLIRNAGVNDFHLAVLVWRLYGVADFRYEALTAGLPAL